MTYGTAGFALLLCLLAGPGVAGTFTEDFTTTAFRDPARTTADWNTGTGELRLFPFVPAVVGSVDTPGNARSLAVAGDLAFVTDASSGLQIIDISDPTAPAIAGNYGPTNNTQGVALYGDYALLADGAPGILVLDITDPTAPTLAGTYNPATFPDRVAVSGDLAIVGVNLSGIEVLDLTVPTSPTLVGSFNTPHLVADLVVEGDLVFVADFNSGLQIIDITNPALPVLRGSYDTPGSAFGVFVDGDLAYIADGSAGLHVIDITDPASPSLLGSVDTPGSASRVVASGDRVFLADGSSGLVVVDVSDPSTPVLLHSVDTPGTAAEVQVSGDHALVADSGSGLRIIETSLPLPPRLVGSAPLTAGARGTVVAGNVAYVAAWTSGLRTFDITDPAIPVPLGSFPVSSAAGAVAVSGDLAVLSDWNAGILVLDVSDPATPTLLGSLDTPGQPRKIAISGDLVLVADGTGDSLLVVDISDPTDPGLVGAFPAGSTVGSVAMDGSLAYVGTVFNGLRVVDLSAPAAPVLLGTYPYSRIVRDVVVDGDLAFLALDDKGLEIVDISNPASPSLLATVPLGFVGAQGVAVDGNLAVVSDYQGVHVFDVTDPSAPVPVGYVNPPGTTTGVTVAGEFAFVSSQIGETGPGSMDVLRIRQHEVDPDQAAGGSLPFDGGDDPILRARLTTVQSGSVTWELSANGGGQFEAVPVDGSWIRFAAPGTDLLWRSEHTWVSPGVNPTAQQVTVDWLTEYAPLLSITDVPGDQGGWARLAFRRSGYDFPDETAFPVTAYGIYRRVDDPVLAGQVRTSAAPGAPSKSDPVRETLAADGLDRRILGGRSYVLGGTASSSAQGAAFPPGVWELVTSHPATQRDDYLTLVPTVADSGAVGFVSSVYLVTTHTTTPSVWFAGAPDSGYSVDNIGPGVPSGFAASIGVGVVDLSWNPAPEPDFQHFRVYRSADPGFVPGPGTLVHETASTSWQDAPGNPATAFYKLTALDHAGNESGAASSGSVVATGDGFGTFPVFALRGAAPNPLRSGTRIAFDLPADAPVSLEVFDVTGRRVRVLADGTLPGGSHEVAWDGADEVGRRVAAGVYLYRLRAGEFTATRRVVVIR